MGVFGRSWELTKLTFSIMKREKELFIFPVLSIIFSVIFIAVILFPTIIIFLFRGETVVWGIIEYLLIFITYFGLAFIAVFFNVCIVYTAATTFSKKGARFWNTIRFAFSKIHLIFLWSLVSATVGLIFRIIENFAKKIKGVGGIVISIINAIFGLAWSIITIFVVPGMVYHNLGPFAAIKKSVYVLKKTWGEYLIKVLGMGTSAFVFFILGIALGVGLIYLGLMFGGIVVALIIGFLVFIYLLSIIIFFSVASQIYDTALYVYAESGVVVEPYTKEMMIKAFRSKKKKMNLF